MTLRVRDKIHWNDFHWVKIGKKTQRDRYIWPAKAFVWIWISVSDSSGYWCLCADHWGSERGGLEGLSRYADDECINRLFIFAVDHIGQRPATVAGTLGPRRKHRGCCLFPVPLAVKCPLKARKVQRSIDSTHKIPLDVVELWRHDGRTRPMKTHTVVHKYGGFISSLNSTIKQVLK